MHQMYLYQLTTSQQTKYSPLISMLLQTVQGICYRSKSRVSKIKSPLQVEQYKAYNLAILPFYAVLLQIVRKYLIVSTKIYIILDKK